MDFSKFVDFLQTYPIWFRFAVASWVFLTAIVVSGFLLVSRIAEPMKPQAQPAITTKQEPLAPQKTVMPASQPSLITAPIELQATNQDFLATLESYVSKRELLEGRFVQLEQFDKSVLGKEVAWKGVVYSVSGLTDESANPSVTVDSIDDERIFFMASASSQQRLFLSSLRKGDKIIVTGKIETAGDRPNLAAESIELIKE